MGKNYAKQKNLFDFMLEYMTVHSKCKAAKFPRSQKAFNTHFGFATILNILKACYFSLVQTNHAMYELEACGIACSGNSQNFKKPTF